MNESSPATEERLDPWGHEAAILAARYGVSGDTVRHFIRCVGPHREDVVRALRQRSMNTQSSARVLDDSLLRVGT